MKVQGVIKRMQECGCVEFHPALKQLGREHPVGPEVPFPSGGWTTKAQIL